MYTFRTYNNKPVENPVIIHSNPDFQDESPERHIRHSGRDALEGLVISLGGEVKIREAPVVHHYHKEIRIMKLTMTDAGLLAIAENAPSKEFLPWGLSVEDADKVQEHILNSGIEIPDEMILERDYLRAINKSFIREHGELDQSDLDKISQIRMTTLQARNMSTGPYRPIPGDTVSGAYYGGKFPFQWGIIIDNYRSAPGMITICAKPFIPYISPVNCSINPSGGPFFSFSQEYLTYVRKQERTFWCFGHAGPCGNGAIFFPIQVNCWKLSEQANI